MTDRENRAKEFRENWPATLERMKKVSLGGRFFDELFAELDWAEKNPPEDMMFRDGRLGFCHKDTWVACLAFVRSLLEEPK